VLQWNTTEATCEVFREKLSRYWVSFSRNYLTQPRLLLVKGAFMTGPLEGIRVVECGGYLSAPSAGYMLGDLGAEVIKIEDRIKGDPVRGMSTTFGRGMIMPDGTNILFETANRNKKSLTLDLKKEKGKELLYRLVASSDVFCTNYSRSAIDNLAIDYQTLKKHNPKLIYAVATGYGSLGPDSEKRAFDAIAQARSGIMGTVGEPDGPPLQIAGVIFDQLTGTLLVNGILAALAVRDKQGIGQEVEVSLLGSGIHLQAYNINVALLRGRPMPRPSRQTLKNPLANHYQCADGKWLLLSEAQSDRFWHSFCLALGIENLEKDAKFATAKNRRDNFGELTGILEKVFKTKTRDEWISILQTRGDGLAFSPVLELTELASDPQILANEYITDVDHPTLGRVKMTGIPLKFSETPAQIRDCAPNFGQHTEEVLMNILGYTWQDIEKLKNEEVI
jgi:crotonobetainyl-CoA:carnitine CoA-transferase CaiB-like acyl-CoA transferase